MDEISGAVVAIALVLSAVFIPTAFLPGIQGRFYQQFALTIAVSTVISAFNALTLSPALCALLLQPHHEKNDIITRIIHGSVGWIFRDLMSLLKVPVWLYKDINSCDPHGAIGMIIIRFIGLTYLASRGPMIFIPGKTRAD
jgi:multidrug efflux pump subunit AcrB